MDSMKQPQRKVEFERLNLLGKLVFVGGSAVRFLAGAIDTVVDRAVDVAVDAERAFRQGLDPNIEDAKIIEEESKASGARPRSSAGNGPTS